MSTCPCGSAAACRSDVVQKSCHKTPTLTHCLCLSIITCLSVCNDRGAASVTSTTTAATPHEKENMNYHREAGTEAGGVSLLCTQGPLVV